MSKRKKLKAKPFAVLMAGASAIMLAVGVAMPIVTNYYDGVLRDFFGEAGSSTGASNTSELAKDLDLMYNKHDYSSVEKLEAAEKEYIRKPGAEGLVLLKNDTTSSKGLPLTTSAESKTKVSLFSHSSVDLISGGTGSGLSYGSSDLKTAFEAANYEVNEQLWNFYKDGSKNQARGEGSKFYGGSEDWSINETPIEKLQSQSGLLESTEGTTAIFVLSRTGGEGRDLGRNMSAHTSIEEDKNKHYLEPDSVELGVINYLNQHFSNVILLVNTNNVLL